MTRVKDSYKHKQPAMRVQARIHSWVFLLLLPSEVKKELLEWPLRLEDQEPEASQKLPWGALIGDGQQVWLYTLSLAEGKLCESLMTSSLQWLSSLRNSYAQTWALVHWERKIISTQGRSVRINRTHAQPKEQCDQTLDSLSKELIRTLQKIQGHHLWYFVEIIKWFYN